MVAYLLTISKVVLREYADAFLDTANKSKSGQPFGSYKLCYKDKSKLLSAVIDNVPHVVNRA